MVYIQYRLSVLRLLDDNITCWRLDWTLLLENSYWKTETGKKNLLSPNCPFSLSSSHFISSSQFCLNDWLDVWELTVPTSKYHLTNCSPIVGLYICYARFLLNYLNVYFNKTPIYTKFIDGLKFFKEFANINRAYDIKTKNLFTYVVIVLIVYQIVKY